MKLDVPDDIVSRADANAAELLVALAVQLYADNRIDHRDACRLARMPAAVLNRELLARHISVQQYPAAKRVREAS
jgi:predicted HTH domain antitoxin